MEFSNARLAFHIRVTAFENKSLINFLAFRCVPAVKIIPVPLVSV